MANAVSSSGSSWVEAMRQGTADREAWRISLLQAAPGDDRRVRQRKASLRKFRAAGHVIYFLQTLQRQARSSCNVWIAEWRAVVRRRYDLFTMLAEHDLGSWDAIRALRNRARMLDDHLDEVLSDMPKCVGIQQPMPVLLGSLRWHHGRRTSTGAPN